MFTLIKMSRLAVHGTLFLLSACAFAQSAEPSATLVVRGYEGKAQVVTIRGRAYVDVEDLAHLTGGSLDYSQGRVELMLPAAGGDAPSATSGFSRPFATAAIETIASMREWGSALVVAIQNSYPVGNSMMLFRGRAMDNLRVAATQATTEADRSGLELLQNEFNNVQAWSNQLVNAQKTMSAGNLAMSDAALRNDPMYQKVLQCGQFLGQMLAGGTFQDETSCH